MLHSCRIDCFVFGLEPNLSSAKSNRAAGAASGGKSPDHQPHKGLCDGAYRHWSCVSQWPPAVQKCQWFLGLTLWRPAHFPRSQAPGLSVYCRQPWTSWCPGGLIIVLVLPPDKVTTLCCHILAVLYTFSISDAGCVLSPQVRQPWWRCVETGLWHNVWTWWVGQWTSASVCGSTLPQWSR